MSAQEIVQNFPGVIPPPAGIVPDLSITPSKWNIVTQSLCIALTSIFMLSRLGTKLFILKRIDWDDYASIAAWIGSTAYSSLALAEGPFGIGIHMWNISPTFALKLFESGYVGQVLYGPVVFAAKLAILLLLVRIFSIKHRFVVFARCLIALLSLYYIAITIVKIVICRPIAKFWDPRLHGSCLNSNTIFISDCIIAIITDCVILCTPLPIIWKLRMSFWSKLGSTVALIAGGLACIASILRLEYALRTIHDEDKSYIFLPILLWSSCEIAIGVICGCLPILPSLFRRFRNPKSTSYGSQTRSSENESWKTARAENMVPLQVIPSIASSHNTHSVSSSQQHLRD